MTDRELLEAAAKAAGIVYEPRYVDPEGVKLRGLLQPSGIANIPPTWWNPLTDDGDALRLAVKLRISVYHAPSGFSLAVSADGSVSFKEDNIGEQNTRRAIIRAAAAMAKP